MQHNLTTMQNVIFSVVNSTDNNDILHTLLTYHRNIKKFNETNDHIFQSCVVFVSNSDDCEKVYSLVHESEYMRREGLTVDRYHSNRSAEEKKQVEKSFLFEEFEVLVTTECLKCLEKKDIRIVIHVGIPSNIDLFLQRSQYAGQDGDIAQSIVIYDKVDNQRLFNSIESHNRLQVEKIYWYCNMKHRVDKELFCRRQFLLSYIGNNQPVEIPCYNCCDLCDLNCVEMHGVNQDSTLELGREIKLLLHTIFCSGEKFGLNVPISILQGYHDAVSQKAAGYASFMTFGKGRGHSKEWWKALAKQLVTYEELLVTEKITLSGYNNIQVDIYRLSGKGRKFLNSNGPESYRLIPSQELNNAATLTQSSTRDQDGTGVKRSSSISLYKPVYSELETTNSLPISETTPTVSINPIVATEESIEDELEQKQKVKAKKRKLNSLL